MEEKVRVFCPNCDKFTDVVSDEETLLSNGIPPEFKGDIYICPGCDSLICYNLASLWEHAKNYYEMKYYEKERWHESKRMMKE